MPKKKQKTIRKVVKPSKGVELVDSEAYALDTLDRLKGHVDTEGELIAASILVLANELWISRLELTNDDDLGILDRIHQTLYDVKN